MKTNPKNPFDRKEKTRRHLRIRAEAIILKKAED